MYKGSTKSLLEQKLFNEKLDILYSNLLISVPFSFLCATIILVALYRIPHDNSLIYWFAFVIILHIIRVGLTVYYHFYRHYDYQRYFLFFLTTILAAGTWAYAADSLMPESHSTEQMIVMIVIAGVSAGGSQSLIPNLFLSFIYITSIIVPLSIWIFLRNDISWTILGVSTILYNLFLIAISWRGNYFLNKTLKLKHENISLATNLKSKNSELNKMNHLLLEKENTLRLIHDNAPIGMAIVTLDGKWMNVNNKLCEIVGYKKQELESHTIRELTYQDDLDVDENKKSALLRGKISSYQVEKRYIKKNGSLIWISTNVSLVRNDENQPMYFISQIEDINDRKQNEKIILGLGELNKMLQLCRDSKEAYPIIKNKALALFPNLDGGLAILNKEKNKMEVKEHWGRNILLDYFNCNDCLGFRTGNVYLINDIDKELICNHFKTKPKGRYICIPLIVKNEVIGLLSFISEENLITSHQRNIFNNFSQIIKLSLSNIHLNEVLKDQAIHDTLTGLYNRRYLYEWLNKELGPLTDRNKIISICMVDIDFFKKFNDSYGHEAGDEILKTMSDIIKTQITDKDLSVRYGGEEFFIALIGKDAKQALLVMEKIRNQIKTKKIYYNNHLLPPITISVGITDMLSKVDSINKILRFADKSLYQAKECGRDQIIIYSRLSQFST